MLLRAGGVVDLGGSIMFRARATVALCSAAILLGVGAASGAGAAVATPVQSTAADEVSPGLRAPAPTCGFVRPAKPGGGRYTCTFTDNFNGTKLDTTKWKAVKSSENSLVTGLGVGSPDCYLDRPENVSVKNGRLRLTSRVEWARFVCDTQFGSFTTSDSAGSVTSWGKFAQTYGRFEFRAKFPSNATPDFISALWMYPQNPAYGKWPRSGEIDVAEWFGDAYGTNPVFPSVHYAGEDRAKSTGRNCVVPGAGKKFHTYAVEWSPTTMSFYYHNKLCFQHTWTPAAPLVRPQPFDQAFDLIMTQTGGYNRPVGTTMTMEVDWVRAWA
jgi:beta-glucanase (GH16 family)